MIEWESCPLVFRDDSEIHETCQMLAQHHTSYSDYERKHELYAVNPSQLLVYLCLIYFFPTVFLIYLSS